MDGNVIETGDLIDAAGYNGVRREDLSFGIVCLHFGK
jgi:hypothetical protein